MSIQGYIPKYTTKLNSSVSISATSGSAIFPSALTAPGYGILHILISVSEPGTLQIQITDYNQTGPGSYTSVTTTTYLNAGNALSANTLYEFDIAADAGMQINLIWTSSSSSVTSATVFVIVLFEQF